MPGIATLARPREIKPPPHATLNWSHPMARQLARCWLMNENGGPLIDQVIRDNLVWNGTKRYASSRKGISPAFANSKNDFLQAGTGFTIGAGLFTLAVWARVDTNTIGAGSSAPPLFGYDGPGSGGLALFDDGIGGMGRQFFGDTGSTSAPAAGQTFLGGASVTGANVTAGTYYLNGKADGSFSASTSQAGKVLKTTGGNTNSNNSFGGVIIAIMLWNRVLSALEWKQLYDDPWAMFRPEVPAGALTPPAAGFTGTIAATAKKATAALTGAQLYTGTVAATAKKATASLQGVMQPSGTVSATAKKATAALIAQQIYTGTIVATAKKATAAVTAAQVYTGTIAATAKKATAALAGVMQPSGTIAATAKKATAALTAAQIYTGSIAATAKKATAALAGAAGAAATGTIVAAAKKATAALIGTTGTFFTPSTNFGFINSSSSVGNYEQARNGTGSTFQAFTAFGPVVGQALAGGVSYSVYEAFVEFDTSALPDGITVLSAQLTVNQHGTNTDVSGGNFTIDAFALNYGTGVTTADWQNATAMAALTPLLASYDTANGVSGSMPFTSTVDFPAAINVTGPTRLLFIAKQAIDDSAPTGLSQVRFALDGTSVPDMSLFVVYIEYPNGTIAATAKKATAALVGVMQPRGTIAATAKKATAALAGKQVYTGTIAATAKKATAVLRGSFTGTIAATAKPATASLRAFFEHVHGNPPGWGIARASMLPAGVARFTRLRGGHVVATILRRGGGSAHLPREDDQP